MSDVSQGDGTDIKFNDAWPLPPVVQRSVFDVMSGPPKNDESPKNKTNNKRRM